MRHRRGPIRNLWSGFLWLGFTLMVGPTATAQVARTGPPPELKDRLQDVIDEDAELDGCLITAAQTPVAAQPGSGLLVSGVVAREAQKEQIELGIEAALGEDPAWRAWLAQRPPRYELRVAPVDPGIAPGSYYDGLAAFSRRDWRGAYDAFSLALRNAPGPGGRPSVAQAGYWRALTALEMGLSDRARAHLRSLRRRGIEQTRDVYTSMERVQGPVREEFERLIREVR